jgi:hypothetical protein
MVERHYPASHKFLCMTNAPEDLDGGIDTAIIPQEYLDWGYHYVNLFAFFKEISETAGRRALFLDLDVTLLGNIAPLLAEDENFRILSRFLSLLEQTTYEALRLSWRRGNSITVA